MSRTFFRTLLLLVLALWVADFPARSQPLPDRAPLLGSALDGAGKPLSGAIISLRRQDSNGAYTFWGAVAASDARGSFRIAQAEAGRYYLSAQVPGFAPISNLSIEWKSGAAPLQLRFDRLVTLRLKIAAPDGTPAANAPFWLRLRGDGSVGQTSRRALADGNGEAVFDELLPAKYALFLAAPGGYATQNALDLRADKTLDIQLQRGGTLKINAWLSGDRGARPVGGALLDLTPETPAEAARALGEGADPSENVAFLAAGGDVLSLLSRDSDGQIEIDALPPGRYLARLRLPGFAAPEAQTVTVATGQIASARFSLAPEMPPAPAPSNAPRPLAELKLDLRVKDAAGAEAAPPPGEWSVRALPIESNGALAPEARVDTSIDPGGNVARRALSDSSGRLTLFPLRAGRYRIFVAPRTPPDADLPEAASIDISVPASGAAATLVVPAAAP